MTETLIHITQMNTSAHMFYPPYLKTTNFTKHYNSYTQYKGKKQTHQQNVNNITTTVYNIKYSPLKQNTNISYYCLSQIHQTHNTCMQQNILK
jgi:hypothetical protein